MKTIKLLLLFSPLFSSIYSQVQYEVYSPNIERIKLFEQQIARQEMVANAAGKTVASGMIATPVVIGALAYLGKLPLSSSGGNSTVEESQNSEPRAEPTIAGRAMDFFWHGTLTSGSALLSGMVLNAAFFAIAKYLNAAGKAWKYKELARDLYMHEFINNVEILKYYLEAISVPTISNFDRSHYKESISASAVATVSSFERLVAILLNKVKSNQRTRGWMLDERNGFMVAATNLCQNLEKFLNDEQVENLQGDVASFADSIYRLYHGIDVTT